VTARKVLRRVLYSKSTPASIAGGMTVGIFVGMGPTFGFQMIPAAFIAALLRVNILAAVLGVWISNPFTAVPIYYSEYRLGRFILPYEAGSQAEAGISLVAQKFSEISLVDFWHTVGEAVSAFYGLGNEVILRLLIGSAICATVAAAMTYPLALWWVKFYRHRRQMRTIRRADERLAKLSAAGLVHVAPNEMPERDDSGEIPIPTRHPPQIVSLPVNNGTADDEDDQPLKGSSSA
jgi:uncharacterized protein (DUF2062 family)